MIMKRATAIDLVTMQYKARLPSHSRGMAPNFSNETMAIIEVMDRLLERISTLEANQSRRISDSRGE